MNERAIEHLFAGLEWDVVAGHGCTIAPGEPLELPAGETALVTPLAGAVEVSAVGMGCAVVAAGADVSIRPSTRIEPGGVLLSLGRDRVSVHSREGAAVRLTRLVPTVATAPRLCVVPSLLSVSDLAASEPGAAALAPFVGHPVTAAAEHSCTVAPTLCRLMGTTVVLAVLRAWAVAGCAPEGWPARATDPYLNRAIEAIHADPGQQWTVEVLAGLAAMSRSSFAERFRSETGTSPLGYLAEVRMASARSLLADGVLVTEAARRLGYASDEGFSRAFRRHHDGVPPSRWRTALSPTG